ncbi:outer membrane protein [Methylocapsa acidiphila]|uniref:outer membrane protein n=1 Tax=Methylocapsa acidiphila TaxID=133552 RepID=UPI00047BC0DB|nr:outer membrane protein [Methylocapsa acidiphila]
MIRRLLLSTTALLVAGSALAADLPYREAPPAYAPPVPIFTWTGLYIGGQIGYAWGSDNYNVFGVYGSYGSHSFGPSGVVGGAHAGYNLQLSQIVLGLEGDIEGSGYNKTYSAGVFTYGTKAPIDGSIRGRVGFAMDRVLFYGTAGVAFASFTNTYSTYVGYDSIDNGRAGWTVGGGLEYAVTNNWSVRAEYRYSDFGTFTNNTFGSAPLTSVQHHETNNAVRAGFSYKFDAFGAAPAVARY